MHCMCKSGEGGYFGVNSLVAIYIIHVLQCGDPPHNSDDDFSYLVEINNL